jgi:hypothetical protein
VWRLPPLLLLLLLLLLLSWPDAESTRAAGVHACRCTLEAAAW